MARAIFRKHLAHLATQASNLSMQSSHLPRSPSATGAVISMLYVLYQLPCKGLKTYFAVPSGFSCTEGSSSPSLMTRTGRLQAC